METYQNACTSVYFQNTKPKHSYMSKLFYKVYVLCLCMLKHEMDIKGIRSAISLWGGVRLFLLLVTMDEK